MGNADENTLLNTQEKLDVSQTQKYGKTFGSIAVDEVIATGESVNSMLSWAVGSASLKPFEVLYDGYVHGSDNIVEDDNTLIISADYGATLYFDPIRIRWETQNDVELFVDNQKVVFETDTTSGMSYYDLSVLQYSKPHYFVRDIEILMRKPHQCFVEGNPFSTLVALEDGRVKEATTEDFLTYKYTISLRFLPRYYVFKQEDVMRILPGGELTPVFNNDLFYAIERAMLGNKIPIDGYESITKDKILENVDTELFDISGETFLINTELETLKDDENFYIIFAYPKSVGELEGISFERYMPVLPAFNNMTTEGDTYNIYITKHRRAFHQGGKICFYGSVNE